MDRFDTLAKIIWNKPFNEVSPEESAAVVRQYPFFSTAHFLHLQKLQKGSKDYEEQYQKAILYYHNPAAFHLFLNPPQDVSFDAELEGSPAHSGTEEALIINEDKEQNIIVEDAKSADPIPILAKDEIADSLLTFEPFHTVDYFASQGIKPAVEDIPKDKFGKQLKSFTDWLKTMKKLPVAETAGDLGNEKKVESLAAHSVEDASVITESMAEVWLKQGNREKALQTYTKLSLQNPAKSAYFAAKIQSINSQK